MDSDPIRDVRTIRISGPVRAFMTILSLLSFLLKQIRQDMKSFILCKMNEYEIHSTIDLVVERSTKYGVKLYLFCAVVVVHLASWLCPQFESSHWQNFIKYVF